MKKLLSLVLALLLMLALFAACGSEKAPEFDPAQAAQALVESEAFSDLLSPIDAKIAASLYGVDEASIAACGVYCSTGATAEEIAVFKCTDEASAAALEKAAHTRLDNQAAAYASYGPESVPKIEQADVRVNGVYVACVVSNDRAAAAAILDQFMK